MSQEEILTTEQAAKYLKVSERTIRMMLTQGRLPGAKIGRAWRVRRADLDAVLSGKSKA
jgi:excisionase family DNA binding protein